MKFSCEKSILIDAINIASKAVSTKSSLDYLEGIFLKADNDLEITGYDMSIAIKVNINVNIEKKGEIVINAKLFSDIIKKLPDDIITIDIDNNHSIKITCNKSIFNILGINPEEYPNLPNVSENQKILVKQDILKNMINKTVFCASHNESKPIHTGCLFQIQDNIIKTIAVDGYRLAINTKTIENTIDNAIDFVMPANILKEIEKINIDTITEIYPNDKNILIKIGNVTIISRLIEGTFLNYQNAIPQEEGKYLKVNRLEFINSVERVSLLINEKIKNPIRIKLSKQGIELSVKTSLGNSYDECKYDGEFFEIEIGFNSVYVINALRAASDEFINIILKGNLDPLIIKPLKNDEYLFLVLPVRLKND